MTTVQADLESRSLQPLALNCDSLRSVEPQAVGATYWFSAAPTGSPYPVTIRFYARRISRRGGRQRSEERTQYERIDPVVPGSGRISVTTRFENVTPGEWEIIAAPANNPREPGIPAGWANAKPLHLPRASTIVDSAFAPIVRVLAPGARLGAWPACVLTGVTVAFALQAWLTERAGRGVLVTLALSAAASVIGLIGAKVWYLLLRRERPSNLLAAATAGMCIQGFVVAALATLTLGTIARGQPLGAVLDAAAPGLLFAMAVGRIGCLLGGCCAGRASSSRFGLWTSDRRVGMRRVPVQLIEAALAAAVGTAALIAVLSGSVQPGGVVAIIAIAGYTGLRQMLLPLRALGRQTIHGRTVSLVLAFAVIAVTIGVAALR